MTPEQVNDGIRVLAEIRDELAGINAGIEKIANMGGDVRVIADNADSFMSAIHRQLYPDAYGDDDERC